MSVTDGRWFCSEVQTLLPSGSGGCSSPTVSVEDEEEDEE